MTNFYRPASYQVNFPSGDVSQWFDIFSDNQFSLFSVNMGRSSNIRVEQAILDDVGSYGRQLGRMGDALEVLIKHFKPEQALSEAEEIAIDDLMAMLREIARVKKAHSNQ
ncbi:MAG: hypothetical protein AAFY99_11990 [Pseudomonadota bacterium]